MAYRCIGRILVTHSTDLGRAHPIPCEISCHFTGGAARKNMLLQFVNDTLPQYWTSTPVFSGGCTHATDASNVALLPASISTPFYTCFEHKNKSAENSRTIKPEAHCRRASPCFEDTNSVSLASIPYARAGVLREQRPKFEHDTTRAIMLPQKSLGAPCCSVLSGYLDQPAILAQTRCNPERNLSLVDCDEMVCIFTENEILPLCP